MTTFFVVRVNGNSADAEAAETIETAIDRSCVDLSNHLEYLVIEAEDRYEAVETAANIPQWKLVPREMLPC